MKKVFVLAPGEDWIVDRFVKEWSEDNRDITVSDLKSCDVIWILADWCWTRIPIGFLATKKILVTVHHVVPEKFGTRERQDFLLRDRYVHAYHVPNQHTADFVKTLTNKPIHVIPYWANDSIFKLVTPETINVIPGIKPTQQRL